MRLIITIHEQEAVAGYTVDDDDIADAIAEARSTLLSDPKVWRRPVRAQSADRFTVQLSVPTYQLCCGINSKCPIITLSMMAVLWVGGVQPDRLPERSYMRAGKRSPCSEAPCRRTSLVARQ